MMVMATGNKTQLRTASDYSGLEVKDGSVHILQERHGHSDRAPGPGQVPVRTFDRHVQVGVVQRPPVGPPDAKGAA
jgi:hypothetical protein